MAGSVKGQIVGGRYHASMATKPPRNRTGDSFFAWEGEVLVVNILGKPSAAKDAIGKPYVWPGKRQQAVAHPSP